MTVYNRPNPGLATETNKLTLHIRPRGFEPLTYGFVVRRSIHLSYGRTSVEYCIVKNALTRCGADAGLRHSAFPDRGALA